jgi:transcriptional regulator with GAF, ATPase, and Fis domain
VPSASLQALLARAAAALEQSEIMPLGDTRPQRVDVRVLAATNTDHEQRVAGGKFRRTHQAPRRRRGDQPPRQRTWRPRRADGARSHPGGLDTSRGNISESARTLGLTRRGLYLKLRRLGLESRSESEVDAI